MIELALKLALLLNSLVPQEADAVGIDYGNLCDTIIQRSLEARKEGL